MRPCPSWPSTQWTSSWKPCFFSHAASAPVQMATTTVVKAVFFVTFLISLNQPLEPSQVPVSSMYSSRSSHYGLWKVNNLVSSFLPIFIICTYILRSELWNYKRLITFSENESEWHKTEPVPIPLFTGLLGTMLKQETFLFLCISNWTLEICNLIPPFG